ncbi:TPA: hypothetical protein N0F65_004462 [Lagenidium giganteum]|uniref:Uncharacterized protein n=1 Tax=Lagenidium giganteum TaxID=4803 RepID=A0AAV2ZGE4_9STRA|nr:TPA: hypothetical protein N0F65_004462 [Lagenidium giganteum]
MGGLQVRIRRRLANNTGNATAPNGTAASRSADLATEDAESQEFTTEQLTTLNVSGWLSIILFSGLALAILIMTYQHFRHRSSWRKQLFHVVLFTSVVVNLPDPILWITDPATESWRNTYPLRILSMLLQSMCKSYISICWSEVVSAGQSFSRRRINSYVMVFNALLLVWAISIPFLISRYPDDVYGQYAFMQSSLRYVLTYSGVVITLGYGVLLSYQGMRLRRRLLQAKGTVPAGSVEKSLNQLMLTVYVIVFADTMRIGSFILSECKVDIPMTSMVVCSSLIPCIFPTICMLYLMRRVSKPTGPRGKLAGGRRGEATLSRYMTDERPSYGSNASNATTPHSPEPDFPVGFALPQGRVSAMARLESRQVPQPIDSGYRPGNASPTFHWVRK